jgi:signal transduction histidine kinase
MPKEEQNGRVSRLVETSLRGILHLQKLVEDLLDLTRLQNRRIKVVMEPLPVQHLLEESVSSYRSLAAEKGQALVVEGESFAWANVDGRRIEQVLANLLSNAVKYTPEGGRIAISCRDDEDEVVVSVTDTGPGIPIELRQSLFHRFERLEAASEVPGLGLGLAIAKGIVELHGGRIWVESEVGEGSTFSFSLKRASSNGVPPSTPMET